VRRFRPRDDARPLAGIDAGGEFGHRPFLFEPGVDCRRGDANVAPADRFKLGFVDAALPLALPPEHPRALRAEADFDFVSAWVVRRPAPVILLDADDVLLAAQIDRETHADVIGAARRGARIDAPIVGVGDVQQVAADRGWAYGARLQRLLRQCLRG